VLLLVNSTHFQWVMPLAGLLHLGRKTAARDRLTDLAYRNNSRLGGVGRQKPCHNSYEPLDFPLQLVLGV